ncbi:hypothetical protein ACE3MQ_02680 [Paenibacillus lentus]
MSKVNMTESFSQFFVGDQSEVIAFREEFPKKPASIFVKAALPG